MKKVFKNLKKNFIITYSVTICSWLRPVFLGLNFFNNSRVEIGLIDRAVLTCSWVMPLLLPGVAGPMPAGGESRDFFEPDGPGEALCSSRTRFRGPTGVGVRFACLVILNNIIMGELLCVKQVLKHA